VIFSVLCGGGGGGGPSPGGGGGAEIGRAPEQGGFYHFMWIVVDGPEVHYAVVKPGAILPIGVIDNPEQAKVVRLESELDPDEAGRLAKGLAGIWASPQGPVLGAAEVARNAKGNLRELALKVMGELGATQWVVYLPSLVHDADAGVAKAAFGALMASGRPEALAAARALLGSSDEQAAGQAAAALALRDPQFPRCVREAIPDLRRAAEVAATAVRGVAKEGGVEKLMEACDRVFQVFPEPQLYDTTLWMRWREARTLQGAGRQEQALEIVDEVLRLAPSPDFSEDLVPDSLLLKAQGLAALGRKEEALAVCKRLQEDFGEYSSATEARELMEELEGQAKP